MVALDFSSRSVVVLVLTTYFLFPVHAYKFLVIGADGGGSHYYVASAIGKELAHRGNNVTVIVSDIHADSAMKRDGAQLLNTHIYKSLVTEEQYQNMITRLVDVSLNGGLISTLEVIALANGLLYDQCESVLIDNNLINLLRQEKIDLIIGDICHICVGLIAQALDVPFASLSPMAVSLAWQAQTNVYPTNPAYIPDAISGLDTRMNFMERVKNILFLTVNTLNGWRQLNQFDQLKLKYNIKPEVSTFEALSQAEFFLINTHFAFDFPRPFTPNVIPIGGLTTKPAKPLNKVNFLNFVCISSIQYDQNE